MNNNKIIYSKMTLLSIDIITSISDYTIHSNLKYISKDIFHKIEKLERSLYWKLRYIEIITKLGMNSIKLDLHNTLFIAKQEYIRITKQENYIKYLKFYTKVQGCDRKIYYSFDKLEKIVDQIYVKFERPFCEYNVLNVILPKEFNKFNVIDINFKHNFDTCSNCINNFLIHNSRMFSFPFEDARADTGKKIKWDS